MARVSAFDGNFMMHRAFSLAGKFRNPENLEKNTLTGALQDICSLALAQHATHILVCFDGGKSFRHKIYKDYKKNRGSKGPTTFVLKDGSEFVTDLTPGRLVTPMCEVLRLAGITTSQVAGLEADDLVNCVALSLGDEHDVIINTRDKDAARCVRERVRLYWPIEKKFIDEAGVEREWGVKPRQMRDYLCLLGDKVDNIPGVPDIGPKTAVRILQEHGSIKKAIRDPKVRELLKPHAATLHLAKSLVNLSSEVSYVLKDLEIREFSNEISEHVWKIPDSLKNLGDVRRSSSIRGLFGRR
jgi:DNA polymerase I